MDLLCCLLQLTSLAYASKSSFLSRSFFSVFLSIHAVPRLVLSLQLSRQLTAWWQVLRMRSSGGREGGRWTNERGSHSGALSLHLQITAPRLALISVPSDQVAPSAARTTEVGAGVLISHSCFFFSFVLCALVEGGGGEAEESSPKAESGDDPITRTDGRAGLFILED